MGIHPNIAIVSYLSKIRSCGCLPQLYFDMLVLSDLAKSLPPESAAGMDALYIANRVVNTFR